MTLIISKDASQEIIFSGLQDTDQEAFLKIYERYSPALLGLIIKWVKNKQTAEMLLCKAFINAWQNRLSFNAEKENMFYWLCGLARICYIDYLSTGFKKNN